MKHVRRILILYPAETSPERVNQPANYSLSRLLLRLRDTDRVPVRILSLSPGTARDGTIRFAPLTRARVAAYIARYALSPGTLLVTQTYTLRKWVRLMRRAMPRARLVVRLGGVYWGREYIESPAFEEQRRTRLHYLHDADAVISTADGTPVDLYMEKVGIPTARYRKWLNGFPVIPNAGGWTRERRVLCISRMSAEKGLDYVLRSFALAVPRLREPHTLTMVGDGPERPALEALARELGVAHAVEFTGDSFDVARHLYSSRLLVSGLANNPVMEAIATGTPVIAVELGEMRALYGGYPNVHVVDYPPGGCGAIEAQHVPALAGSTADAMTRILNDYPDEDTLRPPPGLYDWDSRLAEELALYDSLFERS